MGHDQYHGSLLTLGALHRDWQQRLAHINPPDASSGKECILLLAPSGSGKTTRIAQLRDEGKLFQHIDRDGITTSLLTKAGLDPRQMQRMPEEHAKINAILRTEQLPAYYEAVRTALFATNAQAVVVDYPPGRDNGWLGATITMARQAGHRVVLEGFHVAPELGMRRVLERNTRGMTRAAAESQLGASEHLKMTMATYQAFPEQFLYAVNRVDQAVLFDNTSGTSRPAIATWLAGKRQIHDQRVFRSFMALRSLDLARVRYDATIIAEERQEGVPSYQIQIDSHGTFKPSPRIPRKSGAQPE